MQLKVWPIIFSAVPWINRAPRLATLPLGR
jgi:hypothetical protein